MDILNHKHLFYFFVVAKEGSVKEAAEKLHVSQPTVSDQIRLLEEYFGDKLFERKHRALVLTKTGELALDYAERIFSLSSELAGRIIQGVVPPKKAIDIGITPFMSNSFQYSLLLPLFREGMEIRVKTEKRLVLLRELEEGGIDVLLTSSLDQIGVRHAFFQIGTSKTFVVGHKKLKKRGFSFPHDLNALPYFQATKEVSLRYEMDLYFSKNGIHPAVVGEGDEEDLVESVCNSGIAFVVASESLKERLCKKKEIVNFGEIKELQTKVYAVMDKSYEGPAKSFFRGFS